MTENEWQVSTDPQAMYAFVRDRVTERQMRLFVEACRRSVERPWPFRTEEINWGDLAEQWCDRMVFNKDIPESVVCGLLREIIGNPFRPWCSESDRRWADKDSVEADVFVTKHYGNRIVRDEWLTWNNSTVPNLTRSMMEEECHECYGSGYQVRVTGRGEHSDCEQESCDFCDGKGYVPRAEPQWDMMAIIADALEEAGCTEAAILDHLRGTEPCPHCEGNGKIWGDPRTGVFEAAPTYKCRHCNGTGKLPVRHVRGCWAVELLKE